MVSNKTHKNKDFKTEDPQFADIIDQKNNAETNFNKKSSI
jgi:hypothetical protein